MFDDDLMPDVVDLIKKSGTTSTQLRASVHRNKIYMEAGDLLIERGDLIQRHMSNGSQETYEVVDPGFNEFTVGVPRHYQMTVKPLGEAAAQQAIQHITNYNISGHNARINQNSTDNSTNVVNIDSNTFDLLTQLRAEIETHVPSIEGEAAIDVVNEVQSQIESGNPKKSIVTTLLNSLPTVGNIATIVSTLLALIQAAK